MEKDNCNTLINWINIAISLFLFSILTLLILFIPKITIFDQKLLNIIQAVLTNYPVWFATLLSNYGKSHHLFWPQFAAVSTLFSHKKYVDGITLVIFTQIAWRFGNVIKDWIHRTRPEFSAHTGFSFPSGHAFVAMTFYGILIYSVLIYVQNKFWRYFLLTSFSLMIFFIALARFKLNAHYLTDVLAGFLLGFVLVNLHIIINKLVRKIMA